MSDIKKIKTALVSVYHKDGLDEILALLNKEGVQFLSTGGTQSFIESLGYPCQAVEDLYRLPFDTRRTSKRHFIPKYSAAFLTVARMKATASR